MGKQQSFVETDFAGFLGMNEAEAQIVAIQIALCRQLREARTAAGISQTELAERLETKQPAIARLEAGTGKGVTLDALIEALLAVGVSLRAVTATMLEAERPKMRAVERLAA